MPMSWTLIPVLLAAIPSAIVIALIPMMSRSEARRWASATGLQLDDQRGPLLLAERKQTTLIRSLGVMAGSMTAIWLIFSDPHDSLTSMTTAYVLLACGYAAGVVIAHQRRLMRAHINRSDAANATARIRAAVGEPVSRFERALSVVVVVLAIITSIFMFVRPNGDRAWPMAIAVVGLILLLVATRLVENSPHPPTGEPQADVLWSMHSETSGF